MPDGPQILARFESLLRAVDHGATSTTKYRAFEAFIAELVGIPATRIYTTHVAKPGNFDVRMTQSARARNAWLRIALLPSASDLQFVVDLAMRIARERSPGTAVLIVCDGPDGWQPRWGVQPFTPGPAASRQDYLGRFESWVPDFSLRTYPYNPEELEPTTQDHALSASGQAPRSGRARSPIAAIPLILDSRIRRMLRSAVASSKAIMLVGPPGTGKSTLVEEMVAEAAADPSAYGLTYEHDLSVVTPDESWTVRELLGGVTVGDDGQLEFAPGHVLQAISADQWLLLDEANRADLDRIFGGMLTWLAGQEVTIGRDRPGSPAQIVLTWSDGPRSSVEILEGANTKPGATVYRAGQEWRLIGTYNSLDAHRVFRLGLALGRRFAQIPVPPPSPELFREIAHERLTAELPGPAEQRLTDVIARIYEIHATSGAVALGPALFLTMSGYVEAGIRAEGTDSLEELIGEAYLSAFGTWLVRLEEEVLDGLGEHMGRDDALSGQWTWVREQLHHLA